MKTSPQTTNSDLRVVEGFGDEWTRFDQTQLTPDELQDMFNRYFAVFPWNELPQQAVGFDLGCGSGRWAKLVAPRVGLLHCIDASPGALTVARRNLDGLPNVEFHEASVDEIPLQPNSCDFGYSLGVLHHIPDTEAGIGACVAKLKPGAPLLLYLYYAFDNRPFWFKWLWKSTEGLRFLVSRTSHSVRFVLSQVLAATVYWPLARTAALLERTRMPVESFPLSAYRKRSFYVMRTDALDRFGTRLERRFTRSDIERMMTAAGLERVTFSDSFPFWCAVGYKK